MRSILLLLVLISSISSLKSYELKAKQTESQPEVKYAGPIVYSNEKPPIIVFPTPPTTSSTQSKSDELNVTLNNANIEYVPFPYQELPVLIYKSNNSPPIHVVSESKSNESPINLNKNFSNIDKRLGDMASTGSQRGGRALKWSDFKLFNDKPVIVKTQKWKNSDNSGAHLMSGQFFDFNNNNNSLISSGNKAGALTLANAPHVVYSGHPPIHVFPQPIIIKEPELAEMTSASEQFQGLRANSGNNGVDMSVSASNKHEVSASPPSTQFYAYGGTPLGSGSSPSQKSYGFRVKTKGNKHDTEYSSSQNYENYDDSYSPQHSDGSTDSQSDDNSKYKPNSLYSNSLGSELDKDYDKDYDRPTETYSRDKTREKYNSPKYTSNWVDLDSDNGWLSSLLGYNRWPTRSRRPMTYSVLNSPTNEHLLFAASQSHPMDMESMALMNPHLRHNAWISGLNGMRPTASAMRPVYALSSLFGYRRPPIPHPPPTQYYARFNPGLSHAATNMAPVSMKPMSIGHPLMGMPSISYPVRMPFSPFMMYGLRRPSMMPASGDLAFAESTRNTTNNANSNNWVNVKEDIQMSGSHVKPTFVMPSAKPTSASPQNKPPIIIYQGLRPPVHVYKQPNLTVRDNLDNPQNSMMTAFEEMEAVKNQNYDPSSATTTTSTISPYYQFYSTEDPNISYDNHYKTGSALYIGENSAFSPRLANEHWIPVPQTDHNSKENDKNI